MGSILAVVLAVFAVAFSLAACATKPPPMVLRQGNDTLTLMNAPCNPKVSAMLNPEFQPKFKNASAMVGGQSFDACWILHDVETVYVHFEDGDGVMIPISMFLKTADRQKPKKTEDWRRSA